MMAPFKLGKPAFNVTRHILKSILLIYCMYYTYTIKVYVEFMIPNDRYYRNVKDIVYKSFQL